MNDYLSTLKGNIIEEDIDENIINEMAFFIAPSVKKILNDTLTVTKKTFIESTQPGDIIVAFTANKTLKDHFIGAMYSKLMATFQGSPYTTSKMVLDDETVGGYGIRLRESYLDNNVEKLSLASAVSARSELMLIRVKASDTQKQKAVNFLKSKMGLSYSDSDLFKSVWNRLTNRKLIHFFKDKPLDKKQIADIQTPLFCSTIIAAAYYVAGFKEQFNDSHLYDTWPKDFILSDNTEKICKVDY